MSLVDVYKELVLKMLVVELSSPVEGCVNKLSDN